MLLGSGVGTRPPAMAMATLLPCITRVWTEATEGTSQPFEGRFEDKGIPHARLLLLENHMVNESTERKPEFDPSARNRKV